MRPSPPRLTSASTCACTCMICPCLAATALVTLSRALSGPAGPVVTRPGGRPPWPVLDCRPEKRRAAMELKPVGGPGTEAESEAGGGGSEAREERRPLLGLAGGGAASGEWPWACVMEFSAVGAMGKAWNGCSGKAGNWVKDVCRALTGGSRLRGPHMQRAGP